MIINFFHSDWEDYQCYGYYDIDPVYLDKVKELSEEWTKKHSKEYYRLLHSTLPETLDPYYDYVEWLEENFKPWKMLDENNIPYTKVKVENVLFSHDARKYQDKD